MAYSSPDPLSANWSYDSAIDLFSLNTMMPESFPMDVPNDMLWDTKELPMDFFAAPTDINGFTVSHDESSSDQESDESFSPSAFIASPQTSPHDLDLPSPMQIKQEPQFDCQTVRPSQTQSQPKRKAASISRYSSSPELNPQVPTRKTRATANANASVNVNQENEGTSARGRNAAKRAAHNVIEKRYRTNMNAKFVALEKAMTVKASGVSKQVSTPSSGCAKSSASLKKSEILSNAIAYMQELQEVNDRLRKEIGSLNRERRYA